MMTTRKKAPLRALTSEAWKVLATNKRLVPCPICELVKKDPWFRANFKVLVEHGAGPATFAKFLQIQRVQEVLTEQERLGIEGCLRRHDPLGRKQLSRP